MPATCAGWGIPICGATNRAAPWPRLDPIWRFLGRPKEPVFDYTLAKPQAAGSNSAELAIEIVSAKEQGGGPAVWAMVRVVGQLALSHQAADLFGSQTITRANGGMTCRQAQEIVE